jgi:hypothetical protein
MINMDEMSVRLGMALFRQKKSPRDVYMEAGDLLMSAMFRTLIHGYPALGSHSA